MIRYDISIYDMRTHLTEINLPTGRKVTFKALEDGNFYASAMLSEEEVAYIKSHFMNVSITAGK